ncbi:DUF2589 domain-containing protein [Pseudomonas sp. NPDC087612]|uniref:DUF2589 domain-containing protein n=1 Tax=unclassified Pseudomonas TaxID=196821 RepID=UPI0005EAF91D|nr:MULTISPECIES: DUF2589 domain-containing protein [unclassified Pseudomonas]KJK14795.1 hypothetical protein UB48_23665 [Pseudomonas sp. 2(2015)]QPG61108.1 DUF2589 domain-containing protein [Pseudomonas sp. BIGb0427]QVM94975.1 DUF2589 domain-containing protein [Pseudomonas sp. SORT22]UVM68718.1 DUF2589 domain-containing protein [Pseudomonas sp. B21-009]SDQ83097.1 Protein of unknown function [Pseudomonas sp. UC 17F4]
MATIDNGLIGSVMNALPLDRMISGPLQAMIQAQISASKSYADFLMGVCIQNGKAVAIQFDYDETITDEQGVYKGTVSKKMQIPLLAAVTHPNIVIEEGNIEFELTISQQAESTEESGKEASFGASLGWGKFRLNVKGQVSHKSTQTRKTDTRARYAFNTKVRRQDPPEALMRVIDFLTDAATKPVVMADATAQNLDAMPVSALPMPDEQESRKETAI